MNELGTPRRYISMIHIFVAVMLLTLLFSTPRETARAQTPETETPRATQPPTPAEIIDAINALRLSHGRPALATHPVLMTLAQRQANGIAAGLRGHWRPYGLTLGQLLIMEGYPLAGDLSQDGYRSENWIISMTAQGAIESWLWDDEHSNTMLSEYRSDIGAGVSMTLALRRELKDMSGIANALNKLAIVVHTQGNLPEAAKLYEESLTICREIGGKWIMGHVLLNLGHIAYEQGNEVEAWRLY